MFLDFAENYNCSHLDEAQSAHWNYEQVVSHSGVTHYHCPSEGCAKIMYESVVCISEDLRHDYHAVHHYTTLVRQDIMHMINMEKEIQFLEGAPNQHKGSQLRRLVYVRTGLWVPNREAFWEVPWTQKDHVTTRQVWSRAVHLAVGSHRTIIKNAKQFFIYAKTAITRPKVNPYCHEKGSFIFRYKWGHSPWSTEQTIKGITGSQSLHAFRSMQPFSIVYSMICNEGSNIIFQDERTTNRMSLADV